MQYNFRGKYNNTTSYVKKDVVSYQPTPNDPIKYYFCLTDNIGQLPNPNGDTQYWAIINTLSNFPNSVDTFLNRTNIQASDKPKLLRFQELSLKSVLSTSEQNELSTLTQELRNKLILPEDFNLLQQSISNLQMFFKDNVEAYINQKQTEFTSYVEQKKTDVTDYVNLKKSEIETTATKSINEMTSKKDYFINYVNTKEDEVRALVQDFDSNTARYYQTWTAVAGQLEFNIYDQNAANKSIPPEANLNITEENIDFIVNGVSMTPYTDFVIKNNGRFDTIVLNGNNAGLVGEGTEVVAKWYKNVGKLYFKHASTHSEGGSDPLTVTEGMLDSSLKTKVNNLNKKITISSTSPSSPSTYDIWIDVN